MLGAEVDGPRLLVVVVVVAESTHFVIDTVVLCYQRHCF